MSERDPMSPLPPIAQHATSTNRHGPHRGTIEIRNIDHLADAEELAAAWISEFLDGHGFVFATHSVPNIINLGDGAQQVVGWEVSIDWRAVD